ncbi:MAG TPA: DUF305 domain-containing protein [Vicinamibacterales bacterium]|jgi:uncharacterized protein (DUF305 family)
MKSLALILVPLTAVLSACGSSGVTQGPPVVRPGAPGQATSVVSADAAKQVPQATTADITFMQGMIHHHAQALDMTELIDARSNDPDMKKLGLRIHVSQTDEIKMMQRWLQARGQDAPDPRAHRGMAGMEGMDHAVMMPGMLTPEEMARLSAAKGPEFDRLFLEGMIKHHEGALTMVKDLFATPGAGQQSDIFAFASDVESDQKMEIDRMSDMLKERMK